MRKMCSKFSLKLIIVALVIFALSFLCVVSIQANPIPVYPDPKMDFSNISEVQAPSFEWIFFIFFIDFFVDILIVYSGIFILDYSNLINNREILNFSKTTFFSAVLVISLVGLLSEIIFGTWIGGLVIALFLIFLSFVFVSKYIIKISWANSFRMGLIAVTINIFVWFIVFTV